MPVVVWQAASNIDIIKIDVMRVIAAFGGAFGLGGGVFNEHPMMRASERQIQQVFL